MTKRVRDSPFLKNVKMYDFVPRGHTQEFENTGELEDTKQDGTVLFISIKLHCKQINGFLLCAF